MTIDRKWRASARWFALAGAIAAVVAFAMPDARAASLRVKLACSRDYYAHCSQYPSDSEETRKCMRALGERLSAGCVEALVADGEVSRAEVDQRAAKLKSSVITGSRQSSSAARRADPRSAR